MLSSPSHPDALQVLSTTDLGEFAWLVALNGATYVAYNQMSFLVLSKVEMVSHAVGNAFRRVVTIFVSVWYFQNVISSTNMTGIALAILGVVAYSISKTMPSAGKTKTANLDLEQQRMTQ